MWGTVLVNEEDEYIGRQARSKRKFFDHMVALQDTALNAIKPGAKCSDVDAPVRA